MSVLSNFTCNTCGLVFPGADLQRQHMKSEWHRYNLIRRVADLGPISAEAFAEKSIQREKLQKEQKITQLSKPSNDRSSGGSGRRQITKKDIKRKERLERRLVNQSSEPDAHSDAVSSTFTVESSDKEDHEDFTAPPNSGLSDTESQVSVRPRSRQASASQPDQEVLQDVSPAVLRRLEALDLSKESPEAYEALLHRIKKRHHRAIPLTTCLLDDNKQFSSVQENVDHLSEKYGLFVPEKEFLTDLEGLITYLGEKVGIGHMCIYCNFHGKSIESVRDHMIMKSHIKIPYENLDDKLELADFYDFTRTYAPNQDDGWEDDSDWSGGSDDEIDDDVKASEHNTLTRASESLPSASQGDMYVDETGIQLVIAPGVRVGHRSQLRFFKQSVGRGMNVQESRNTILAADRRGGLVRAPPPDKYERRVWKQQRIAESKAAQREKNLNFQAHYRDQLLQ